MSKCIFSGSELVSLTAQMPLLDSDFPNFTTFVLAFQAEGRQDGGSEQFD